MNESLVFSAASNFMTNTVGRMADFGLAGEASFCFGLDAPVSSVPAGYTLETILFLGNGVNSVSETPNLIPHIFTPIHARGVATLRHVCRQ